MIVKKKEKWNYLTEGIILAIIPAGLYLATLLHELGVCYYFKIPNAFIVIELREILSFSGIIFVTMVLVLWAVHKGWQVISQKNWESKSSTVFVAFIRMHLSEALIAISLWFFFYWESSLSRIWLALFAVLFLIDTLIILISVIILKLSFEEAVNIVLKRSITGKYQKLVERLVIVISFFSLCYASGTIGSLTQSSYYLDENQSVLICRYGDYLILGELENGTENRITEIHRVPLNSHNGNFILTNVGVILKRRMVEIEKEETVGNRHK